MYICIISFAFLCHCPSKKDWLEPPLFPRELCCVASRLTRSVLPVWSWTLEKNPLTEELRFPKELQGCRRKTWNRSWLVAACWAACCSSKVAKVLLLLLKKRGIAIMWYLYNWFTTRTPLFSSENPLILMLDISGASSHMVTGQYHHVGSPVVSCCDLVPATSCNIRMGHRMWISWDPLYHRCTMFGLCFAGYFHEFRFQTVSFSDGSTA